MLADARRWTPPSLLLTLALALAACGEDAENSVARGDALWADSAYAAALAEYRLAYDRDESPEVLARVAHAYAMTGQFERTREHYEALLRQAPEYTDQAVFDYLALAERAGTKSDRYGMAGAIEAALALRPGLRVEHMTLPLARYYATSGEAERALSFYERALATSQPDSVPTLLFEMAELQERRGECRQAIELYNAFLTRGGQGSRRDRAANQAGACSWTLAQAARQAGDAERALFLIEGVTARGLPQNIQDEAWFERGEILLEQGRNEEALEAYQRSIAAGRAPGSQLAERARRRIDEIRFGRF